MARRRAVADRGVVNFSVVGYDDLVMDLGVGQEEFFELLIVAPECVGEFPDVSVM